MTASENIKTPAMEIPLLCIPNAKAEGERLKKEFTQVLLKDVREWSVLVILACEENQLLGNLSQLTCP